MGDTRFGDIPGARIIFSVACATVAMGSSATRSLFVAPMNLDVEEVDYIPDAAMSGHATNTKIVAIRNEGTDGSGTTVVVAADTFGAGDDLVAQTPRPFTVTSTTADAEIDDGEVVSAVITEAGTGVAWPSGVFQVTCKLRDGT